jgi:hypothetical protein
MTVNEFLCMKLMEHGMNDHQAHEVLDYMIHDQEIPQFSYRAGDPIEAYDKDMIWAACRVSARRWIVENYPRAWFRPFFENHIG